MIKALGNYKLLLLFLCLSLTGCEKKYKQWYSVEVINKSSHNVYDCKISNWQGYVRAGGRLGQGHRSTSGGIVIPVPDKVIFKWKTALEGGEEYLEKVDDFPEPDKHGVYPEVELYPSDKFQSHEQTIVLKGKVPERLFGEIIFTFTDEDGIEVSFVEEPVPSKDH